MKKLWIFPFVVTIIILVLAVCVGYTRNTNTSFGYRTDGVYGSAHIHLLTVQGI